MPPLSFNNLEWHKEKKHLHHRHLSLLLQGVSAATSRRVGEVFTRSNSPRTRCIARCSSTNAVSFSSRDGHGRLSCRV